MQNTTTNTRNDLDDDLTLSHSQNAPDGPAVDLPTIATLAVYNTPPWAGDIIASIPEEGGTASEAEASGICSPSSPSSDSAASAPRQPATISECPLHTAMRHLAEAAVAQHVLYLEGEVRARPDLVNAVSHWEHMHTLIRACICPATREVSVGASAVAEIVDARRDELFTLEQQPLMQQFVHALEACAACTSTAQCLVGASSAQTL